MVPKAMPEGVAQVITGIILLTTRLTGDVRDLRYLQVLTKLLLYALVLQHSLLIDLAGDEPRRSEVDEDRLALTLGGS